MSAGVLLWARAILRRHWRSTVFLAVFAGLAGGAVMTAWDYSRRAHGVISRRLEAYAGPDGTFNSCPPGADPSADLAPCLSGESNELAYEQLRASRHVDASTLLAGFAASIARPGDGESLNVIGTAVVSAEGTIAELQLLAGRRLDDEAPDEVVLGEAYADAVDAGVGDVLEAAICGFEFFGDEPSCEPAAELRVVGIVRQESDILPARKPPPGVEPSLESFGFYVSRAWHDAHRGDRQGFLTTFFRLSPGSSLDDVRSDLSGLLPGWTVRVIPNEDISNFDGLRQSTQLQGRALFAVALILLVAAVVFVGQAFARQVPRELAQHRTVGALGILRRDVLAVAALRSLPIGLGAAAIAVIATAVASSFGPTGLAGRAEVDGGFRPDWLVLVVGGFAIVVLATAAVIATAVRTTAARRRDARRTRTLIQVRRSPPLLQAGLLLGRGRRAGHSLTIAVLGTAAAAAAGVVAATLVSSLDRLEEHPSLYGASWSYGLGEHVTDEDAMVAAEQVRDDPLLTDASLLNFAGPVRLGSVPTFALVSFVPIKGELEGVIVEGRAPAADDEVAVGRLTLDALDLEIGDVLEALPLVTTDDAAEEGSQQQHSIGPFEIVGVAILNADDPVVGPGKGMLVTDAVRRRVDPAPGGQIVANTDRAVPEVETLARLVDEYGSELTIPNPQSDIRNLGVISGIPWVIAGLVSLLALAALANALIVIARRNRGPIAVLRTLGFTRPQVVGTVAAQATAVAALAAVVGVPLGVIGGRWGWDLVAREIGVVASPIVPLAVVFGSALLTVLAANLIALWPGVRAGRDDIGVALRAE